MPHLAFFAKTQIRKGQEITFDYRFKEEEGGNKVRCGCGAPNCKVRPSASLSVYWAVLSLRA